MYKFIFVFLISSRFLIAQDWTEHIHSAAFPNPKNPNYLEQISCDPKICIRLEMDESNSKAILEEVYNLIGKNAGKIVIEVTENSTKIDSPENENWKEYLREIAKRNGTVVFEPYYIQTRSLSLGLSDIPLFGDIFRIGNTIYSRMRTYLLYSRMENYNAKVLYHPTTHEILLFYFVHKRHGSICDTVFSDCKAIEYLDDDIFDFQLQEAMTNHSNQDILIQFHKTEANIPLAKIDLNTIISVNRSARLYKWLIASKDVEKKSVKKERFLTVQTAITVLDYSITAYDYIQAYRMYSNARNWKTSVSYEDTEDGMVLRSVHFKRIKTDLE
jgi:hypothetical protein